jgi:Tol biopolymer transport system component
MRSPRSIFAFQSSTLFFLAVTLLQLTTGEAAAHTVRASVSSGSVQGNGISNASDTSLSGNGRFVAFQSAASNLVGGDTNGQVDVFVRDQETGVTVRVSVSSAGEQSNGESIAPSISNNGRYVAFASTASNLVPGDTNGVADIFLRDLQQQTTTRISVSVQNQQADGASSNPVLSNNGQFFAFESAATNLVPNDTNGALDVFTREVRGAANSLRRVSLSTAGEQANERSILPSISGNGRLIAFESYASNLVPGDSNSAADILVRDLQAGTTTRVSTTYLGGQGDGNSFDPSLSNDGRYIAFEADAANLVVNDTNGANDVFVRDLQGGASAIQRVSVSYRGEQADGGSFDPELSDDGRFVAWVSEANNLVFGDTNSALDIFSRDLRNNRPDRIARISVSYRGEQGEAQSRIPTISGDGKYVAFGSEAANLVVNDTNAFRDVFVRRNDASSPPGRITFSISPKQGQRKLNLGSVKVRRSKTRSFTIANSGGRQLVVRIVAPESPFFVTVHRDDDLSFTLEPRRRRKITVAFRPTEAGRVVETLRIQSDDSRQPETEVQLIGVGR